MQGNASREIAKEKHLDHHSFAPFGETLKTFRQNKGLTQQQLAAKLGVHRNTIGHWERGDHLPDQRGIVLDLAKKLRLGDLETRQLLEASLTAISPYWSVPVPRNPCFTGRETVLQRLRMQLAHQQPVALTQTSALSGLGGIGKTQIAVEYAYRYELEYSAVFWVAAETAETLMSSVQQIAEQLQLPERQAAEQSHIVTAVQRWLATHTGWLLVLDNVEDSDLLQMLLPAARQGACLLTTRRRALGPLVELLEVPPMTSEEGISLLQRRARGKTASEPASVPAAAVTLVNVLEGLPLALDQAGAYLEETGCGIERYLQRFHAQRKHILAHRGTHGGAHPDSVATTLLLAVEQIEQKYPAAADLLRVCAFLHPEAIPEELFSAGASHLGPVLGPVAADPYHFDLALAALRNASLVSRHPETQTLSIHRLVQAVLADQMEPAEARFWNQQVVRMVNTVFPEVKFEDWAQGERYFPHALACLSCLDSAGHDLPEVSEVCYKAGSYLLVRGRFEEARSLLEQAIALGEQQYGPDHPVLLSRLNTQAELYWRRGDYRESERVLQRTLALAEQHFDPTHPHIVRALSNLGVLAIYQGVYIQAEPMFLRAVSILEQRLGAEHPDTAAELNNLALCYEKQGKYAQAEPLYWRALQVDEQTLGSEHLRVSGPLHGLADLYAHQGNYAQAEPLYQRALDIRENQLGPEHHRLANPLEGLADCAVQRGEFERAEALYQRALRVREQQVGREHPEIALTLSKLATLYQAQGQDEQAERVFHQAFAMSEQHLGSAHPQTVEIHHAYSCFLKQQRKATGTSGGER